MTDKQQRKKSLFEWTDAMMCALAVLMIIFIFFVKVYTVYGTSMHPTLEPESKIVVMYGFYIPRAGDVVVVDKNSSYGESLVKRVIATENQVVSIDDNGILTVDGVQIDAASGNLKGNIEYPVTVPEGCCFLMGDNREVSYDSRYSEIGFISNTHIIGRVVYVLTPAEQAGPVE